ncbi:DUF413 domain-containing protein [Chitinophaga sp. XS-30]|uniref:DUF413 domain-containing protein n=1 Tax=Chitinophaga sp. XS-30 TaxID=2604421 RepID=UPI0011DD58E4|nr:DUF413 domain-containing protein [Chitinophaga sp. XS-30]QEH42873.1 hypothetical protein FW415_19165 [Chitinophaga sp. XS-30]
MNTNNKTTHIEYIKAKGKFAIACNTIIFSNEEIKLLEKYGHWLEALSSGTLLPCSPKQQQFIEVIRAQRKPETNIENLWFKYIKRKEIEAKYGKTLYATPTLKDDPFYNRDMAKMLKRTMFKVTKENHKNDIK